MQYMTLVSGENIYEIAEKNTLKISIVSVLARPNKHHRRSLDITLRVSLPKYQPISIREDGS
jgi:hypothetical protein